MSKALNLSRDEVLTIIARDFANNADVMNLPDYQVLQLLDLKGFNLNEYMPESRWDQGIWTDQFSDIAQEYVDYDSEQSIRLLGPGIDNLDTEKLFRGKKSIKFKGKDMRNHIVIVGRCDVRHPSGSMTVEEFFYHFIQRELAQVTLMDDDPGHDALHPFVGTKEEAIAFAKKMDPDLKYFGEKEWMAFAGAQAFLDATSPMYGEFGKLIILVDRADF